jgi:hypothetical protein
MASAGPLGSSVGIETKPRVLPWSSTSPSLMLVPPTSIPIQKGGLAFSNDTMGCEVMLKTFRGSVHQVRGLSILPTYGLLYDLLGIPQVDPPKERTIVLHHFEQRQWFFVVFSPSRPLQPLVFFKPFWCRILRTSGLRGGDQTSLDLSLRDRFLALVAVSGGFL